MADLLQPRHRDRAAVPRRGLAAPTEAYTAAKALTRATDDIAQTAAAVWLVVLLAYRYQLTRAQLGWRPDLPARRSFRQQGVLTAVLYTVALAAAIGLMGWLQEAGLGGHGYPHPPPGAPGVLPAVTDAVNAGIVEELVLVAALVTVLEHAHQPPWRIYTIGMIVRWSFHIYYGNLGWGMLTTLPLMLWAAAAIGLFRWTRRITPLIGVHIGWDLLGGLDQPNRPRSSSPTASSRWSSSPCLRGSTTGKCGIAGRPDGDCTPRCPPLPRQPGCRRLGSVSAQRWATPSCSRLGTADPSCATGPSPPSATPTNR